MKLTVGFSRPKKTQIPSQLIRLYQGWTPYSHVYIKLEDTRLDLTRVYEASHGFLHDSLDSNFYKHNIVHQEFKFEITKEQSENIERKCVGFLQRRYGFKTILGILLKKHLGIDFGNDGNKTFICSEFASVIMEELGLIGKIEQNDYMTPKELFKITKKLNDKINGR